jgi:hypothetical protein
MRSRARKPYAHTRLVAFLNKRILELRPRKTQIEIAAATGFMATHSLAMFKSGAARLPLDRIPALARALECDPAYLFLLAIEQQDSALAVVLADIARPVTKNELTWLDEIRSASEHGDPALTRKAAQAIRGIFGK